MRRVPFTAILGASIVFSFGAALPASASEGLEDSPADGFGLEPFSPWAHTGPLEAIPLNKTKKSKKKKKKEPEFEDDYRYDFGERHLTWGVNVGGGLANGIAVNAFPLGGAVTPYFKGAFGDGNALQFDVTVAVNPLNAQEAEWVFFRTPILGGSAAYGFTGFVAPTLTFKYEIELTSSISKRSKGFFYGGVGIGPAFSYGQASLIDNGSLEDTNLINRQIFFDLVPTVGIKYRLGEFSYLELGSRFHFLFEIASKLNDEAEWSRGTPEVIEEFWIGNSRYIDVFLGFSYDFK